MHIPCWLAGSEDRNPPPHNSKLRQVTTCRDAIALPAKRYYGRDLRTGSGRVFYGVGDSAGWRGTCTENLRSRRARRRPS